MEAEAINKEEQMVYEENVDVTELVSQLELATTIIKRQHQMLVDAGIDPQTGLPIQKRSSIILNSKGIATL